jgi:hypothetical protein
MIDNNDHRSLVLPSHPKKSTTLLELGQLELTLGHLSGRFPPGVISMQILSSFRCPLLLHRV